MDNKLVGLVIMIKDEANKIQASLDPYVQGGINRFFVYDTGSTDNTLEKVQEWFQRYPQVKGKIVQEPFVSFAISRNKALRLAEKWFPEVAFLLMPDAEWYMTNVYSLIQFCQKAIMEQDLAYRVRLQLGTMKFYQTRLIRSHRKVEFKGVVHEGIDSTRAVPDEVFWDVKSSKRGQKKSFERWIKDKDLLLAEHAKNPNDPRTVFYLAQTYHCLKDYENAKKWYSLRISMPGYVEETFVAYLRLGEVLEKMGDWCSAMVQYLKAYAFRPSRIEPLICIATHFWINEDAENCFVYAQMALAIPVSTDILFVEQYDWDFVRYNLVSQSAKAVKQWKIGYDATEKALKIEPKTLHLKKNLAFYRKKLTPRGQQRTKAPRWVNFPGCLSI